MVSGLLLVSSQGFKKAKPLPISTLCSTPARNQNQSVQTDLDFQCAKRSALGRSGELQLERGEVREPLEDPGPDVRADRMG